MQLCILTFPANAQYCCPGGIQDECGCMGLPVDIPDEVYCSLEEWLAENTEADEDLTAKVKALKSGERLWTGGGAEPLFWIIADPVPKRDSQKHA